MPTDAAPNCWAASHKLLSSLEANCWRFVATVPQLSRAISSRKDSFFAKRSREDFEEIVTFLASVPLFKNQLPRSELPKVARSLKRKVWEPGTEIVKQGDLGKAFFLIMSGEADVLTRSADSCNDHVRATLRKGDYFGGRTLLEERSNVATIRASGEASLVTLSMSRRAFHDTGIDKQLKFPKRAAIYNEHPAAATPGEYKSDAKTDDEIAFIAFAVRNNANLRALIETDQEQLSKIAACAEQRIVEKGTEVAKRGEVGDEFFIIREGSFDIVLGSSSAAEQRVSAEERVALTSMSERLLRKQHFLQTLSQPSLCRTWGRTISTLLSPKGVEDLDMVSDMFLRGVSGPSEALRPKLGSPPKRRPKDKRMRGNPQGAKRFAAHTLSNYKGIKEVAEVPDSPQSEGFGEDSTASTSPASKCEVLTEGDSFGELSLLYNMRREATFRAREPSVIYAVPRRGWESAFSRKGPRFDEYCALLEEVHALEPLVSSERYELACNAQGLVYFPPGERVITQGRVRQARLWYVIYAGSAVMNWDRPDGTQVQLSEVGRPGCFGERSLLRGDAAYDVNVTAGENGMTCLTFNGETIRLLLTRIYKDSPGFIPDIHADIEEWCKLKAEHAESGVVASNNMDFAVAQSSGGVGGRSLENYTKLQVLGRGAYGEVYLVEDTIRKKHYALKVMSKGHIERSGIVRQVRWERELLSMLDSKFVIRLHRTIYDEQHIFMLLEVALGGNLMELLHTHPQVFLEDMPRGSATSFYAACIIAALEHLHERSIVHRDLKPENAMLDEHGYAKLCDMGFARFVLNKTNTLAGTPEYLAPEVIDYPHDHDMAVDWWALGVMVYELLAGQTPFHDEGIADPMARLLAIRRSQEEAMQDGICFPFHFPSKSKGFVQDLLRRCPDRLGCSGGARAVQSHDMFRLQKFNFQSLHARTLPSPFRPEVDIPQVGVDVEPDCCFTLEHDPTLYAPVDKSEDICI